MAEECPAVPADFPEVTQVLAERAGLRPGAEPRVQPLRKSTKDGA